MDARRFDGWTRRRFGLATGSLFAALLGLGAIDATAAKHRHHHHQKRCERLGNTCGGKRPCCGQLLCARTIMHAGTETLCCKREGNACGGTEECCDGFACDEFDQVCVPLKSDRALKTNVGSIDPGDMLARVRELPISTWNSPRDDPSVRHIGPMAQDFAALFRVGADDRHIHPLDGQGITLAAIQALAIEVERRRQEHAALADRLATLTARRSPSPA
jgi:hypothetical protein